MGHCCFVSAALWGANGRGSSHCISWYQIQLILNVALNTTLLCGTMLALDGYDL